MLRLRESIEITNVYKTRIGGLQKTMCGRFSFYLPPSDLRRLFGCDNLINYPARYNAAPMQDHPVIIHNRMGLARWGFLPPGRRATTKGLPQK